MAPVRKIRARCARSRGFPSGSFYSACAKKRPSKSNSPAGAWRFEGRVCRLFLFERGIELQVARAETHFLFHERSRFSGATLAFHAAIFPFH